ncbi:helix-turn-helix domain-containing protein [Salmonella enterica subsp. enterica serovar Derby]|nr:helix-turn-helix domain-containing protein [Salmonella enterica subsp. enterica serovar Derby]
MENKNNLSSEVKNHVSKWGKTNISAGWTIIPNALLENQSRLGLSCIDTMVLINLIMHWWEKDNPPRPSKKRLANMLGVSLKTVQRSFIHLEQCGAIKRIPRYKEGKDNARTTNHYDLNGLVDLLEGFSKELIEEREANRKSEGNRPKKRGNPKS